MKQKNEAKTVGDGIRIPRYDSPVAVIIGVLIVLLSCSLTVLGDLSQNIQIDPIENHKIGDKFVISGTTSLPDSDELVLMIHPTKDYEIIKKWVAETKNPVPSFAIECEEETEGAPGNITRYYADGTSDSRTYPMPLSRAYLQTPVNKGSDGKNIWKVSYDGMNFLGDPMKPGDYSVVVLGADDTMNAYADTAFTLVQ